MALYANVLTSYFLADDYRRIGRAVEHGVYADWQRFMRPVVVWSFVADVTLWRFNPLGYHLTNLLPPQSVIRLKLAGLPLDVVA